VARGGGWRPGASRTRRRARHAARSRPRPTGRRRRARGDRGGPWWPAGRGRAGAGAGPAGRRRRRAPGARGGPPRAGDGARRQHRRGHCLALEPPLAPLTAKRWQTLPRPSGCAALTLRRLLRRKTLGRTGPPAGSPAVFHNRGNARPLRCLAAGWPTRGPDRGPATRGGPAERGGWAALTPPPVAPRHDGTVMTRGAQGCRVGALRQHAAGPVSRVRPRPADGCGAPGLSRPPPAAGPRRGAPGPACALGATPCTPTASICRAVNRRGLLPR